MQGSKRRRTDENTPISFDVTPIGRLVDPSQPSAKKRRVAIKFASEDIRNKVHADLIAQRAIEDAKKVEEHKEIEQATIAADMERRRVESRARVELVLGSVSAAGYDTLFDFMDELINTKDPIRSSQVSRMLISRGENLLDSIRARQPNMANQWAIKITGEILAQEGEKLVDHLRPAQGRKVSDILNEFSLARLLQDAERLAPSLCQLLRKVEANDESTRRDRDLVLITTICMLAHARNEKASEFQTTTCIYLLAGGASRSQFDVLNHAGFTLSYTQAISKVKILGLERLKEIVGIARTRAFMIIWDNLNIAFRKGEQRHDSKDTFENGTTATLVPLFDVAFGGLPLHLKPRRETRLPVLKFGPEDLLPTAAQVQQVEAAQLWHIEDILFDAFPDLRKRFRAEFGPVPTVLSIPVHKTEQYPLPAMHIDESSLEGTLEVLNAIICDALKLSANGLEMHGIVLCAGDQLSISLLDKVSASRRDDTDLVDNVGRYTEGQLGLFHVKIAADRMVTNEFWGKPNSKSPWSLWKINSILGRKAITAGWKAKSLPPFRPSWELILTMTLPAHILDGYRLMCPHDTLDEWVASLKDRESIREVARKVLMELCSARRVAKLRRKTAAERDVPYENIQLFNRDALYLRILKHAIKNGDVGSVLNILTHWMVMFRGTGKMPKYADALFHLLINLKRMDSRLRHAFLMNWLANLSGKPGGFKEMDLLQEHQNFWAKIIYNAKGSNRTWKWLAMVSVSIFALRDVIRHVQAQYNTPYNGTAHSTPSTKTDVEALCKYLQEQELQSYHPGRENNQYATPVRDLMAAGAEYANKAGAFKNFKHDTRKARNKGVPEGLLSTACDVESEDEADHDLGGNMDLDMEDLTMDDEEFPSGTDIGDFISMTQEVIDELSRYD